ncbi:GntR family transcriptional regulator [Streptomyces sp. WAC05374]|uniref:GntR family transcriptional regulator n=1 Tax=Streptomyces sp. WAC05374 TaxID=2487420 RepID=UPI000F88CABD|nr:GntR family transcriptional regulator [Streptomyces sp. WAC05374]RST15862.1 GntR family transcriptional regulator [Streptomyces sp. WAC05374]TDF46217.1 GntR family transcriptional regulator [Streptomyces sp. WAC05374]TDF53134.1 GntR family transcriptional regulator [Streptomyces sp. WAC05374]TDF58406.1 GntR family transcriptional regulator [Streptomyces sp. WAC05374]
MVSSAEQRRPVVVLYERIVDAIHAGTYPPGSTLPSEPKLAAELGVSRPALREALLLLQEDGLLSVRRGVGRTVADRPPRRGFEHIQPLEELIGAGAPVRVRALLRAVEEPTDFTAQHLLAAARARLLFWESLLAADGAAAALSQEWAAAEDVLDAAHPAFARALEAVADGPDAGRTSMLAVLAGASRGVPLSAHSSVTATLVGQRRGEQLGRPADTPAVLITQVVRAGDTPVLAAKHMLPTGAAALPVLQSN